MEVIVLDELLGSVHAVRLERLPAGLLRVECGVHHHAVRVEMGVQLPAGVVAKTCSHNIAGHPFAILAALSHPSLGKFLQFGHRQPDGPVMQVDDSLILIKRHDRHALWRPDREVIEDATVRCFPAIFVPNRI